MHTGSPTSDQELIPSFPPPVSKSVRIDVLNNMQHKTALIFFQPNTSIKNRLINTIGMCENHALEQHCRVCGGRLQKAKSRKTYYDCTYYKEELRTTFVIDVRGDSSDIHSKSFCGSCYAVIRRHSEAVLKGLPYEHSVQIFPWERHTDNCSVCTL